MSMFSMLILSLLAHIVTIGLAVIIVLILQFFGFTIPLFEPLQMKAHDIEFTLVDNPEAKPKNPTKLRSDRNTRSGGQVVKNQPKAEPQRAAGNPSPKPQPRANKPQPRRQPTPPQPRQQQAAKTQSSPAPKVTQAPTPKPTPPQPKIPNNRIASATPTVAPNPIAPTIKTPMPSGPKTVSGPVVKTASSSGSGSGASGVGPRQIAGAPISRSSLASGSPGGASGVPGGGQGGRGSFNQSGSPGGGGGPSGVDAQADVDFGPWMAELQRRVKRNWNPPAGDRSKRVVVRFSVARDGRLTNIRVETSSGVKLADDAALAAVRASAPFRPLPAGYRSPDVDIQFLFDYMVAGGGGATMR